jgi:hypothetical protein
VPKEGNYRYSKTFTSKYITWPLALMPNMFGLHRPNVTDTYFQKWHADLKAKRQKSRFQWHRGKCATWFRVGRTNWVVSTSKEVLILVSKNWSCYTCLKDCEIKVLEHFNNGIIKRTYLKRRRLLRPNVCKEEKYLKSLNSEEEKFMYQWNEISTSHWYHNPGKEKKM